MKLSNLILEEYQELEKLYVEKTLLYRDAFKNYPDENTTLDIMTAELKALYVGIKGLPQDYKNALYMEQQIEKAEPQEETSIDFISSCCICNGQMVATGGKKLDDPTREEYVCKDCHGIEFRVV